MSVSRLLAASVLTIGLIGYANAANGQPVQSNTSGTVVSATDNTLVIQNGEGEYVLFVMDRDTTRPSTITPRSEVSVSYFPATDDWAPAADAVRITREPAQGLAPPPQDTAVPVAIRQMERDIERQARRYRIGVRGGSTLDPELVVFGVHSQLGPFFTQNFWARPNLEVGFGEVTTLVALNIEGIYRLPVAPARGRWMVYLGAGPSFNFSKLGFDPEDVVEDVDIKDRFNFDDLELDTGINFMIGMQSRSGTFLELRNTVYSKPHLRLQVGKTF